MAELTFFNKEVPVPKIKKEEINFIIELFMHGMQIVAQQMNIDNETVCEMQDIFLRTLEQQGLELPAIIPMGRININ